MDKTERRFTEPTIITDPKIIAQLMEMINTPPTEEAIKRNKKRLEILHSVRRKIPDKTIKQILERFK